MTKLKEVKVVKGIEIKVYEAGFAHGYGDRGYYEWIAKYETRTSDDKQLVESRAIKKRIP